GYYRVDYQSRRWLADFGVDQVSSVSGTGSSTTFVNADARYQLSRDTGFGGVVNVRRSASASACSVEGYLDNANSYGIGRGQVDYATDPQTRDATITLQQTWNMRAGTRLSTTAAVDRIRSTAITNVVQDSTIVRLAVYGGGDLTARLALDGSVQWATAVQGQAAPSRSADVSLTWQVARAWSVLASYYENRVGSWTPLVVTSPLAPPTPAVVAAAGERGVFLTVRYQEARGAHFVPLGGVPGSGSGRLSGVVYLDTNENGRYDAGESGAANVTVILDGRFSVRSDSNGRFDFPAVAAGHHVLTVQADNLPLPWTLTNSGRTEVDVATRDRTEVHIGALRLK
ncbi:MAG TPA: SdrD B-like domain-containing protein, partial [Mycobacterium sp.]|nr:SdrD B-like domain-containing protein [Mycobacterium sp.]